MDDLLFLAHRIPYPPNKGDKIRSYHLLRYLSSRYRVHLGAFVDDFADWQYCDAVKTLCASSCLLPLDQRRARLRSLRGLVSGEALTVPYYQHHEMARWVARTKDEHRISRVLVFSSAMAQYVMAPGFECVRKVIDFVDVDSDKWRQYAKNCHFPMSWVYQREAARLEAFETEVARFFDVSVFVSEPEVEMFRELLNDKRVRVTHMNNGVDTDYFAPSPTWESPYESTVPRLVFTGVMDYWANIDAVSWFANKVFPLVREKYEDAEFYIVGMRPTEQVYRLAETPGVIVTGAVPDVRPYLQHAQAVVAPLRIARGIQNKVLEAMAMAKTVVASPQAMEGIPARMDSEVFVAGDEQDFSRQTIRALGGEGVEMGEKARHFVCDRFSWEASLPQICELLEVA